jgi:aerobic-type carbon monoxide dehydrogenase small subunit (CoxS/CutS family)
VRDTIQFTLNGKPVTLDTDASRTLLWVLRTDLALTGTKYGCGVGQCGSCTVLVDGKAVRSCQLNLEFVQGKKAWPPVGSCIPSRRPLPSTVDSSAATARPA